MPLAIREPSLRAWKRSLFAGVLAVVGATAGLAKANDTLYLSDPSSGLAITHQQQWGDFGVDRAAARAGGTGNPLRIGAQSFAKGLGHHANGEIVVDLRGEFSTFTCLAGVQWQGGHRGSVVFRVAVDGTVRFETGPMTDSDGAKLMEVPVTGARELRLIARDGGDGIGCDMADWAEARLIRNPGVLGFGHTQFRLNGKDGMASSEAGGGFTLISAGNGPQVALMPAASAFTVCVDPGEEVQGGLPLRNAMEPLHVEVCAEITLGSQAEVELAFGEHTCIRLLKPGEAVQLSVRAGPPPNGEGCIATITRGSQAGATVRWTRLSFRRGNQHLPIPLALPSAAATLPPPIQPALRPGIEQALIEWDWRMQDGIGTPREPRTYAEAIPLLVERGDRLIEHLAAAGTPTAVPGWDSLRAEHQRLARTVNATDEDWEHLWRQLHALRRRIACGNPLAPTGPLVFAKHVPSAFSHQLTQYSGRCARPGGGLFRLEAPGKSMQVRQLADLPSGDCLLPDVSWDGQRILFAYCKTDPQATDWRTNERQFYHLYEVGTDGSGLRQLTGEEFDDFAPRELPNGKLLFLSTRRGGFHRCGRGPCPVYTLAEANGDGSDPRVISHHETHEWDPAVLDDGRVIYTRWDYVDRNAVHYQQLWTARPDGSDVRAFYGNNTLNPVGVWEARPVPGTNLVMATAAAHHAMTAGSIILLDPTRGTDGLEPITRLTPDALFPESEFPVGNWRAPSGLSSQPAVPVEERRWPGHCYRTPYPLSRDVFLAAYSFEPLVGEPFANQPNLFGLYLIDRFGNKELIYRDLNVGSLWPIPLRARPRPPVMRSNEKRELSREGTFFVANVGSSWPELPAEIAIKRLRILQVLPKTTPHANNPRVGQANASPGKQVLGTVPVESDGSAFFRAPAGIPLAFQALDGEGMAVQTMRSLTYLQPGEQASCAGCHEHRETAPLTRGTALALRRAPSVIEPAPDGSKPFSYAILVQPVLDRHCVACHSPSAAEGGVDLTGLPSGEFTASYTALVRRVAYSEWKGTPQANCEPLTHPGAFGARASRLTALLGGSHGGVTLSPEEMSRLVTWMDANALFYGTFEPAGQQRQQRGERIAGPVLE